MNDDAKKYWDEFWQGNEPHPIDAWKFGVIPDELTEMVIAGKKTTTTSIYTSYEARSEPLPHIGKCSIILDSKDKPVAIIEVVDVKVMPMNEVPMEHRANEGDCGQNGELWWDVHEEYFTSILKERGEAFSEDMLVVCEEFKLIDSKTS